jgi:hypothetical protein
MEKTTMFVKTVSLAVLGLVAMMFVQIHTVNADGNGTIKNYFSNTASKVKATTEPAQKREILDKSFKTMLKALDRVESSGLISKEDRTGFDSFKTALQEKQNELLGHNGYERISDAQLNAFSDYVVQDMEQAAETVTISVVAALLIVIIIILIAR